MRELPTEVRDSFYDTSHGAHDAIRRMDLPLLAEICDWLGIGGKRFVRALGFGHRLVGIQDEPGIWKRRNKTHPQTSKRELLANKDNMIEELREIYRSKTTEQKW